MKILKKIALVFVTLVLIITIVFVALGLILPNEIVVNNQIEIESNSEEIWQVMEDRSKYSEWTPNIEKIEIIDENKWKEFPIGSDMPIIFENVELDKPSKYELKYEMKDIMNGEWVGTFEKTEKGILLKTQDKLIHKSWMGKIFMPLFFDLDTFAKEFNESLKKRVETIKNN